MLRASPAESEPGRARSLAAAICRRLALRVLDQVQAGQKHSRQPTGSNARLSVAGFIHRRNQLTQMLAQMPACAHAPETGQQEAADNSQSKLRVTAACQAVRRTTLSAAIHQHPAQTDRKSSFNPHTQSVHNRKGYAAKGDGSPQHCS